MQQSVYHVALQNNATKASVIYEQPPPHNETGRMAICMGMGATSISFGTLVGGTVHCLLTADNADCEHEAQSQCFSMMPSGSLSIDKSVMSSDSRMTVKPCG